jgi:hypothetical protein
VEVEKGTVNKQQVLVYKQQISAAHSRKSFPEIYPAIIK